MQARYSDRAGTLTPPPAAPASARCLSFAPLATFPRRLAICALMAWLLYFPGLGRPALWEPDEGRYAEIAREMVQRADYVTPRNDWVRYFEKPPLIYWMTAGAVRLLGPGELAVRLPDALFSVGQVVVTEAIGEAMFGPVAGLWAALALGLSPLFFGYARFATLDPGLAFFTTAAFGAFYLVLRGEAKAPSDGAARRRWALGGALMLALGTLTKGPVALVLVGGALLLHLAVERRLSRLRSLPWLGCALVYLVVVAPWFVLAARRNPGFLAFFLLHEHLHRYLAGTEHRWGPYFPALVALAGSWPWLYFAPLAPGLLGRSEPELPLREREAIRYLLIWCCVVIGFFSLTPSKLGAYVLPALPALALLAGRGLDRLPALGPARARRLLCGFAASNLALALSAGIGLAVFAGRLPPVLIKEGILVGAGLFAGGLIAAAGTRLWPGALRRVAAGAAAAGVAIALAGGMRARAAMAPVYTCRRLARIIKPHLKPGCLLASDRRFLQSLPFYTGWREALVGYRGELAPFAGSPGARASFIADRAAMLKLWHDSSCVVLIVDRSLLAGYQKALAPHPLIIGREGPSVALLRPPPHLDVEITD